MRAVLPTIRLLACLAGLAALVATPASAAGPGQIPKPPGANPDDRGWEKVSPDDKGGVDISGGPTNQGDVLVSQSGDAAVFASFSAFTGATGGGYPNINRSVRGAGSWSARGIMPPFDSGGGSPMNSPALFALSPDFSRGIVSSNRQLDPAAPPGVYNLYGQDMDTMERTLLTPVGPPPSLFGTSLYGLAASSDFKHAYFYSAAALTPDALSDGFGYNLYELVDGSLRLASVLPGGAAAFVASRGDSSGDRMVSEDLRRVFFHVEADDGLSERLYMHEDGETVRVSPGAPGEAGDAFLTATPDGSKVLYSTEVGSSTEIRILDAETGERSVVDDAAVAVIKASDDLDKIYFTAHVGTEGQQDLWLWERDGGSRHIATLEPATDAIGDDITSSTANFYGSDTTSLTGDGNTLVFATATRLSDYDNQGRLEVYRYDAVDDELDCVSCPAGGQPAAGESRLSVDRNAGGLAAFPPYTNWNVPYPWLRTNNVSADGRQVFFQTSHALVREDVNRKLDVYRWSDGQASLVSSGTGAHDAGFKSATADGRTVLFLTRGRLVASDEDDLADVYAARVGGGFPEPSVPGGCTGDGCRGAAAGPLAGATLGSAGFRGRDGSQRSPRATVLRVARGKMSALAARLRVRVSRSGSISVSGRSVRSRRTKAGKAGTYALKVVLRPDARRALRERGRVRVAVRVTFRPGDGRAKSRRLSLTFKRQAGTAAANTKGGR